MREFIVALLNSNFFRNRKLRASALNVRQEDTEVSSEKPTIELSGLNSMDSAHRKKSVRIDDSQIDEFKPFFNANTTHSEAPIVLRSNTNNNGFTESGPQEPRVETYESIVKGTILPYTTFSEILTIRYPNFFSKIGKELMLPSLLVLRREPPYVQEKIIQDAIIAEENIKLNIISKKAMERTSNNMKLENILGKLYQRYMEEFRTYVNDLIEYTRKHQLEIDLERTK